VFGSRTPAEKQHLTADLPGARVTDYAGALEDATVVVITLPYREVAPFLPQSRCGAARTVGDRHFQPV
jgi:predicted dinucleotide-binding enzyme